MQINSGKARQSAQSSNYLKPGIHENCYLQAPEIKTTEKGNTLVEFKFIQKGTDASYAESVWFPKGDAPMRDGETQEQANQREVYSKVATMLHIMDSYMTQEESNITGDFESWVKQAIAKLKGKRCDAVPVRIKLIANDKGYSKFPYYRSNNPFIQNMKEDNKLAYTKAELEKLNETKAPDTDEVITKKKEDDNLPF